MGLMSWLKKNRIRRAIASAVLIFTTANSGIAMAELSQSTRNHLRKALSIQKKISAEESWTAENAGVLGKETRAATISLAGDILKSLEEGEYKEAGKEVELLKKMVDLLRLLGVYEEKDFIELQLKARAIAKSLAENVLAKLRAGKINEAYCDYQQLGTMTKILSMLGAFDHEIKSDYESIIATLQAIKRRKEKFREMLGPRAKIPAGTYLYQSKNLRMKIVVKRTENDFFITINRKGYPIEEGEWELVSQGKPKALNDYVLKYVFKGKIK